MNTNSIFLNKELTNLDFQSGSKALCAGRDSSGRAVMQIKEIS